MLKNHSTKYSIIHDKKIQPERVEPQKKKQKEKN